MGVGHLKHNPHMRKSKLTNQRLERLFKVHHK